MISLYLTPGVGAPGPVLVPGFFNDVPGPVLETNSIHELNTKQETQNCMLNYGANQKNVKLEQQAGKTSRHAITLLCR